MLRVTGCTRVCVCASAWMCVRRVRCAEFAARRFERCELLSSLSGGTLRGSSNLGRSPVRQKIKSCRFSKSREPEDTEYLCARARFTEQEVARFNYAKLYTTSRRQPRARARTTFTVPLCVFRFLLKSNFKDTSASVSQPVSQPVDSARGGSAISTLRFPERSHEKRRRRAATARGIDFPMLDVSPHADLSPLLYIIRQLHIAVFSISARAAGERMGEGDREEDGERAIRVEGKETTRMTADRTRGREGVRERGGERGNVFRVRATAYGFYTSRPCICTAR